MELRRAPAAPEDLSALVPAFADIYVRMMEECDTIGRGLVEDWRERLVAYFTGELRRGAMALYLVQSKGAIIGSAAVFLNDTRTNAVLLDRSATLAGVYVLPEYRGRGIARALTERAIAWARERGCVSVRLVASPAAERLYRSLGFRDGRELVLDL